MSRLIPTAGSTEAARNRTHLGVIYVVPELILIVPVDAKRHLQSI